MVFKLRTSKETMKIFEDLNASIHLQPYILCKLAIALSVRDTNEIEEYFNSDNDGLELNRQTVTGEYDDLFKALIIKHSKVKLTDEEYFPKYLKAHIDRGAVKLLAEYKYSNKGFYKHLLDLNKSI
jgi:DNA sulfur modification protein DndE